MEWTPIDSDEINWDWITVWMLMCPYTNKRLTILIGTSCDYGRNRWCGTIYWRRCNQARSRYKVGIADVFLNYIYRGSTNHEMPLLIQGKHIWWCTAFQPSFSSLLMSWWFMLISRKCHPLLFVIHCCFFEKGSMLSFQVLSIILDASSSSSTSVYISPDMYISLATTASSIEFIYSRILMIMRGCCLGIVLW